MLFDDILRKKDACGRYKEKRNPAKHPNRKSLGLNVEQRKGDTSATGNQSYRQPSNGQRVLQATKPQATSPTGNRATGNQSYRGPTHRQPVPQATIPTGNRATGNQSYRQPSHRQPVLQATEPQATRPTGNRTTGNRSCRPGSIGHHRIL
jgi:hypothetical protein